jgi:glycosyltransferase involved in cell wall biosynthesis
MTSIYGWNQGVGGTYWYRIREPLRGLGTLGHQWGTGPQMTDWTLEHHDTIVAHMLHEERASEAWEKIARRNQHKLVIDVDDDVWNFDPRTDSHKAWSREMLLRLQNNIAMADVVTTPSAHLAHLLSELNPNVKILPNYVPEWVLSHRSGMNRRGFVMGYQGARQHAVDLQEIAVDVRTILDRHRKSRVRIYGELNPVGWPRLDRQPWQPDVPTYYRSLHMTIGLGPLADIPFNYAKSAVRAVEYAALGIPAMLTDVPVYREYVTEGFTGWLIPMGESWVDRLEWAYQNRDQVEAMGKLARRQAENWTTEANAWKWEAAYRG